MFTLDNAAKCDSGELSPLNDQMNDYLDKENRCKYFKNLWPLLQLDIAKAMEFRV